MSGWHAIVLGVVEGLTEFLPVSSTGHLILVAQWLGTQDEAAKVFEVVIQSGALVAVLALYRERITAMWQGLFGRNPAGRRLAIKLLLSFMPAAVVGVLLHDWIKARLFSTTPVIAALAAGGVVMVTLDPWLRQRAARLHKSMDAMTFADALVIGLLQCLALWPGTSRAMVTILGALLVGLPPIEAAEYSFLLALPTLGAATIFDALKGGHTLFAGVGPIAVLYGLMASAVVAALAMRGFIRYLARHGFQAFGWYRIGLALVVWTAVH